MQRDFQPDGKGHEHSGDISVNLSACLLQQMASNPESLCKWLPSLNYSKMNIYIMFSRKPEKNINEFTAWLATAQAYK